MIELTISFSTWKFRKSGNCLLVIVANGEPVKAIEYREP
jgi:hypothetical protein